jgi:enoyl-[acyl-carrier protein] reductase I
MEQNLGASMLTWKTNQDFPVGKGATVQEFVAAAGEHHYTIDVAPWGEGRMMLDGREIARIDDAKGQREAFSTLTMLAERHLKGEPIKLSAPTRAPLIPAAKAKLLQGKRGLIVGIANEQSIAWGCARAFRALGADLAITYLNERARKHVEPLAVALEAEIVMPLDVGASGELEKVFESIRKRWGALDFVVHSIAFSPKNTLRGRVTDVDREGFLTTMEISCWTFMRMAHLAEPLMSRGGSLFAMTYYGSQRVVANYNVMGVAKAALEAQFVIWQQNSARRGFGSTQFLRGLWRRGRRQAFPNSTSCSTKPAGRRLPEAWFPLTMLESPRHSWLMMPRV